jgi:hypothetical protein
VRSSAVRNLQAKGGQLNQILKIQSWRINWRSGKFISLSIEVIQYAEGCNLLVVI